MIKDIVSKLPKETIESFYGKDLQKKMTYAASYLQLTPGNIIPDLKMVDQYGKTVNILDVTKGYKYTLLDFWASWCRPCRDNIPSLKNAYNEYKSKGINIIGISLDKSKQSWMKAIEQEKLEWPQFIELQSDPFSLHCGIEGIPAYILIDSQGKLIALDVPMGEMPTFGARLSGPDLSSALSRILNEEPGM